MKFESVFTWIKMVPYCLRSMERLASLMSEKNTCQEQLIMSPIFKKLFSGIDISGQAKEINLTRSDEFSPPRKLCLIPDTGY